MELYRQVADGVVGDDWVIAHIEIASHEFGHGNFASVVEHATCALSAPPQYIMDASRGVAGILLSIAQEFLDSDVDEEFLRRSISLAADNNERYYAGSGLQALARARIQRGERAQGRAALEEAIAVYDGLESALSAPGALLRLATLEKEDGDVLLAGRHIEIALEHLSRYPYVGQGARVLRDKLLKLRDSLP